MIYPFLLLFNLSIIIRDYIYKRFRVAERGNFIEISVKDTGVGIPGSDLEKLFDIDKQSGSKGTMGETGTGLGLIICRELVERHSGKMWVESIEGKGSKFTFSIPSADTQ